MKNKLKLLVFISVVFLSGCTFEYNIEIKDDYIIEKTSFVERNQAKWDSYLNDDDKKDLTDMGERLTYREFVDQTLNSKNSAFSSKGDEYYNVKKISNNQELGIKMNYTYKIDEYSDSFMAKQCFKYFNLLQGNGIYVISTSKGFKCFEYNPRLDDIKINVQTNHKVKNNNADEVNDNIYTWNINRTNASSKSIFIEFYKDKYVSNYKNIRQKIFVGILIGLVVLFIIFLILKRKYKKTNGVI